MAQELTPNDIATRRLRSCVEAFPGAETGEYNPHCCRFPKACSPYSRIEAYQAGNLTEDHLEPASSAPVRFERATSPVGDTPVPRRRDAPAVTEKKILEPMRFSADAYFDSNLNEFLGEEQARKAIIDEFGRMRGHVEAAVLAEKLATETVTNTEYFTVPKTWWDMFKVTFAMTWWLGWLVKRRPAQFDRQPVKVGVTVDRYVKYPEANVPLPSLGRPVPYERLTNLTLEEIEDHETLEELERKAAEAPDHIMVFSLIPETFEDLSTYTGLDQEWFEEAYKYDQDFDLQSKIYVIPEGFVK